jgi:hypothetical protein
MKPSSSAYVAALDKSVEYVTPQARTFLRIRPPIEIDDTVHDNFHNVKVNPQSNDSYSRAIQMFAIVKSELPDVDKIDAILVLDKTVPILRVRLRTETPVRSVMIDVHNYQRHYRVENNKSTNNDRFRFFVGFLYLLVIAMVAFDMHEKFLMTITTPSSSTMTIEKSIKAAAKAAAVATSETFRPYMQNMSSYIKDMSSTWMILKK